MFRRWVHARGEQYGIARRASRAVWTLDPVQPNPRRADPRAPSPFVAGPANRTDPDASRALAPPVPVRAKVPRRNVKGGSSGSAATRGDRSRQPPFSGAAPACTMRRAGALGCARTPRPSCPARSGLVGSKRRHGRNRVGIARLGTGRCHNEFGWPELARDLPAFAAMPSFRAEADPPTAMARPQRRLATKAGSWKADGPVAGTRVPRRARPSTGRPCGRTARAGFDTTEFRRSDAFGTADLRSLRNAFRLLPRPTLVPETHEAFAALASSSRSVGMPRRDDGARIDIHGYSKVFLENFEESRRWTRFGQ